MTFHSILFKKPEYDVQDETVPTPVFFADLNLDQIVDAITLGRQEYNLQPFYLTPLGNIEAIGYRQSVMQDLEDAFLLESIRSFAKKMRTMREQQHLVGTLHYHFQRERWFLHSVETYCSAVKALTHDLSLADLKSDGCLALRDYLTAYAESEHFATLVAETERLVADLATVRYCIVIKGSSVKVRRYEGEFDYSAVVEETFEKFKQGAAKDYRIKSLPSGASMNHVEAMILDCVGKLYPDIFTTLDEYCAKHRDYVDQKVATFDREVQFYVAYLEHLANLRQAGLRFCYPQVSNTSKDICDYGGFDLALAHKLVSTRAPVVCNDFCLMGPERILVVSGPNQGGKTTFARAFGQLHYLARLGCPVPGQEARLFLCDQIFTHFEKQEDINNLRGKLLDDLVRVHTILEHATTNSIIIMNEIFTSTTIEDAIFLGKEVMGWINRLDALCVCVTFIDELASASEKTVSMVSEVVPENPTIRTFKIVRKPADGLSYALTVAEKHRLTYDHLRERIPA